MRTLLLTVAALLISSVIFAQQPANNASKNETLVAVYSYSGNTRHVALQIQKGVGDADFFEIKPVKPYSQDYNECVNQAKKEINDNYRPELADFPKNINQYKTIFIGSPNWWGTMAPPVATFIEKCGSLKGVKVVPFFTHGGGGMQNCEKDVKAMAEKAGATVLQGKTWSGYSATSLTTEVQDWAKSVK